MAGRSRSLSPSTNTHTAHTSQEWRGTSGARTQTHTAQHPSQQWRGTSGARQQTHKPHNTPARSGGAQKNPKSKHTHPHGTPQTGVAEYKQSAPTNAHTAQHRSQKWRGTAKTRAQAHTPTQHTPARSGWIQAKRTQKTHTPQHPSQELRDATRSPSPSTHTNTAQPCQEWPGTSSAPTQAPTDPYTPASSGGAQPKPEPKHSNPHHTP